VAAELISDMNSLLPGDSAGIATWTTVGVAGTSVGPTVGRAWLASGALVSVGGGTVALGGGEVRLQARLASRIGSAKRIHARLIIIPASQQTC
jgi:hypothetical protein